MIEFPDMRLPAASLIALLLCAGPAAADDGDLSAIDRIPSRKIQPNSAYDDPTRDGWDVEVFNDLAGKQLDALGIALRGAESDVAALAAPEFACAPLRPEPRTSAFADAAISVLRAPADRPSAEAKHRGPDGLRAAVANLAAAWPALRESRTKFKTYRVRLEGDQVESLVDVQLSGRTPEGSAQLNAEWRCRWTRPAGDRPPLLLRIEVIQHEEIAARSARGFLFADVTEAALAANPCFRGQLVPGLVHWWGRLESAYGFQVFSRYGLAVGDANGDGLDDAYVCQPAGLPNRLFIQNPDGTATDRSAEAGVDFLDLTTSALLLDLDGDGDQDLFVATVGRLLVLENDGKLHFSLRSELTTGADTHSICAADYDRDGDLDLFVCVNDELDEAARRRRGGKFSHHDATDGAPDHLFRNDGGWAFTEVTDAVGLGEGNNRHSLAACWEDYDNDGDSDLYVANDFGPHYLWRNDGGRFVNVAHEAGAEDYASGMSASWGDYDRDGAMDLYVGNMWSSAGGRITHQDRFRPEDPEEIRRRWQRFTKGNTLLRNAGNGTFQDVTYDAAVDMGRWSWSSNFADLNNDGWEDLVVANGFLTGEDPSDL